jgi:zinc transport system substrate-binding protein
MWPRLVHATALLAAALFAAGCGASSSAADRADGRLAVVAAFYPLQFVAEQVGGDRVAVLTLVPPGAEPHDLELSPREVAGVIDADVVVFLRGFQPAVDDAVAERGDRPRLDAASVQPLRAGYTPIEDGELHDDERGNDPHVWLAPTRLAAVADATARTFGALDNANAAAYTARARALRTRLEALDGALRTGLASCAQTSIVVSHNAFGYLADRYGLTQVPITGLTPEDEPSGARLAEVARFVRRKGVRVIFFETLVSPKVARTLAAETGARAEVLDPIEGVTGDDDYFSVMRRNLATLRGALGCT